MVNCDKGEDAYIQNLERMPREWYCLPYGAEDAIVRVEDMAQASNIPKICVVTPSRSIEDPAIKDVKALLLSANTEEALADIVGRLN